jgi:Cu-Zn family superoxide dismutase
MRHSCVWSLTCSIGGASAGAHYNPLNMTHGGPQTATRYDKKGCDESRHLIVLCRHVGDLGNIVADANGVANFTFTYDNIFSIVGANTIVGRALVLHQDMDDLGLGNTSVSMTTGMSASLSLRSADLWPTQATLGHG